MTQHEVVFADIARATLPPCDTVLVALGTTIKTAGSKQAFAAVDLDAVVATAAAAKKAGARAVGVVSAMGASASSGVFYSRTKGQMEAAITALGFERTVFVRPSFLAGDRAALKQAERPGEAVALVAMRWLNAVIPANYRAVHASDVARSLIGATAQGAGVQIMLSGALQRRQP